MSDVVYESQDCPTTGAQLWAMQRTQLASQEHEVSPNVAATGVHVGIGGIVEMAIASILCTIKVGSSIPLFRDQRMDR
jgi:hypothetical protein